MLNNSKLQNAIKLSSKIQAYVPATMHDQPIDNTEYVDRIATIFSQCFGGATCTEALGLWLSGSVGLIRERITIVFAYCTTDQLKENIDRVVDAMETLKTDMQQEAIALEINGEMYFI